MSVSKVVDGQPTCEFWVYAVYTTNSQGAISSSSVIVGRIQVELAYLAPLIVSPRIAVRASAFLSGS
jgi:hypothetical protein